MSIGSAAALSPRTSSLHCRQNGSIADSCLGSQRDREKISVESTSLPRHGSCHPPSSSLRPVEDPTLSRQRESCFFCLKICHRAESSGANQENLWSKRKIKITYKHHMLGTILLWLESLPFFMVVLCVSTEVDRAPFFAALFGETA